MLARVEIDTLINLIQGGGPDADGAANELCRRFRPLLSAIAATYASWGLTDDVVAAATEALLRTAKSMDADSGWAVRHLALRARDAAFTEVAMIGGPVSVPPKTVRQGVVIPMADPSINMDNPPITMADPSIKMDAHVVSAEDTVIQSLTVEEAIGALTKRQSEAVRLRMDGATVQEIADEMGISSSAVRELMARARRRITNHWKGET